MAENTYVVQEGDTLSKILYEQTGDGSYENYNQVAIANGLINANDIYPGQVINLGSTTTINSGTSSEDVVISLDEDEANDILNIISDNEGAATESSKDTSSNSEIESKVTAKAELSSDSDENTSQTSSVEKKTNVTTSSTEKTESTKTVTDVSTEKTATTTSTVSSTNTKTNSGTTTSIYSGTLYEVCCPSSVSAFEPKGSFKKFVVKENAGEAFVAIDQRIKKCSNDIGNIISNLKKLKDDMGENTGTTEQIEKIASALEEKENDLQTKEKELLDACNQVVDYIYKNKSTKTEEATKVAQTISNIKI